MPDDPHPPDVVLLGSRRQYRPDVVSLACSRVAAARKQSGLTADAFAAALGRLLGWTPSLDLLTAWETTVAPPGHIVIACEIVAGSKVPREAGEPAAADDNEIRLARDLHIATSLDWLDRHARWEPGTTRRKVAARLSNLDPRDLQDAGHRRGRVTRQQVAAALSTYYAAGFDECKPYRVRCCGERLETSVLTRPGWLDLDVPLHAMRQSVTLSSGSGPAAPHLDDLVADAAVQRLAEVVTTGTRLVNAPIYDLLSIEASRGLLSAAVTITEFVDYALTMDLLETELVDAVAHGRHCLPDALPLRDRFLPDTAAVLGLDQRLCAGGPLALCAIARPGSHTRAGRPDYLLLIQERSGSVLNAARRLAVIPKAFHQPISDHSADAALAATLERELEEELLGREDVDSTHQGQLRAEPMHRSLLSEPMRWLTDHADGQRWSVECTGFGLNLVSGNFEFASLIVISDEDWWDRFGGSIQANWESAGLRCYSSLDRDLLVQLCHDPAWSNEGLFALLQAFRRLAAADSRRVNLPTVDLEV
jgi:hypothetical protein